MKPMLWVCYAIGAASAAFLVWLAAINKIGEADAAKRKHYPSNYYYKMLENAPR